MVGADGSPASEAAIALAFEEASIRTVDLVAAHTWIDFSHAYPHAYAHQFVMDWDRIETGNESCSLNGGPGGRRSTRMCRCIEWSPVTIPFTICLEQAVHAQLLVVGSRGRGGSSGMLLGSTSRALIHHAPCLLLVARPITATSRSTTE